MIPAKGLSIQTGVLRCRTQAISLQSQVTFVPLTFMGRYLLDAAGSIPDGVIGIFRWHNPSGHAMALGLTQPLTEMSTSNISWRQRRPVLTADNLTTIMYWLSWNLRASTSWKTQGLSRPEMGLLLVSNLYSDSCQLQYHVCGTRWNMNRFNTLRTGSFKLFKRPFPGFLTILTL